MSDSYPSVGLRVDLNEIAQGQRAYERLGNTIRGVGADVVYLTGELTKEQKAHGDTLRAAQNALRQKMAMTKQLFAEEDAAAKATATAKDRAARDSLQFAIRLNRQRSDETRKVEAEERRAQAESLRSFRNMIDQRMSLGRAEGRAQQAQDQATFSLRQRLTAQMLGDAKRAEDARIAEVRAAAAREEKIVADTLAFRMRLARQRAAEEARMNALGNPGLRSAFGSFAGNGSAGGNIIDAMGLRGGVAVIERFGSALSGMRNVLGSVRSAVFDVRTAVGVFLAGMIIGPIVKMADAMTALEARTRFYAARATDVPYTFEAIYDTAQRTRTPLEAVAMLYTRLAPLAERLGKSQTDILRSVETVSKAYQIGGATPEEARSSSQQLAQALGSNRLGGDELRSLSENAPILLAKIAASLHMNTGEFIKWAHAGKANAEVVLKAIDGAAADIDDMFRRFPVTIGQATTTVGNSIAHLIGEVNKATGASEGIAKMVSGMGDFLGQESTINAVAAAVNGLGAAFKVLGVAVQVWLAAAPIMAATTGVVLARMALAGIVTTFGNAINFASTMALTSAGRFVLMNRAMNAMSVAAAGAAAGLGRLVAFLGGPLGIAIIAAVGLYSLMADANRKAAAAAGNLRESMESSLSALDRAVTFTDAYGVANNTLKSTLDGVVRGSSAAAQEAYAGVAANDAAGLAAVQRAERERLLTMNILKRAEADAMARGGEARSAGAYQSVQAKLAHSGPYRLPQSEIDAIQQGSDASYRAAIAEYQLATGLAQARLQIAGAKLDITKPGPGGTPSGNNAAADAAKGMAGAINAIKKMWAEVKGLKAEVATVSADPLSVFAAQIRKAGEEAAAARTAGKGEAFAGIARSLAEQKEELTIRLQLLKASAENTRQAVQEAEGVRLQSQAHQEGAAALSAYYAAGVDNFNAYQNALDAGADAELRARLRQEELSIAQRYGVDSIDKIAVAYQRATHASNAESFAVQASAVAEYQAVAAKERGVTAADNLARATDLLTQAEERRHARQVEDSQIVESVGLGSRAREVDDRAREIAEVILNKRRREGVQITNEQAMAQARVLALIEQQIVDTAKLKIDIQDSIRDAFIQTGKLDFSSLKKGLGQAIRKAIYDNLVAKPIKLIVDAVVNVVTKGIEELLAKIAEAAAGKGKGEGTAMDRLTQAGKALFDKLPAVLKNGLKMVGEAMVYAEVGNQISDKIGLPASNRLSGTSKAIMSTAAAIVGNMIGGPIGAVLAVVITNAISRLVFGKESNHAAIANFDASGNFTGITGDKRTAETTAAMQSIATATTQYLDQLKTFGINAGGVIKQIDVGTRDDATIRLFSGEIIRSAKGDADALNEAIQRALLANAVYTDQRQGQLVKAMLAANASLEQINMTLTKYMAAQEAVKDLELGLLRYTNPRQAAVQALQQQQLDRRRQFRDSIAAGFYTPTQIASIQATLPALEARELADALASVTDAAGETAHTLRDFQQAQSDLADFTKKLLTGSLSPLAPESKVALDSSNFFAMVNSARGGNFDALTGLQDSAQTYLEEASNFYGSSAAYASIFQTVQDALNSVSGMTYADPLAEAITAGMAALQAAIQQAALDIVAAVNDNTDTTAGVGEVVAGNGSYGGGNYGEIAAGIIARQGGYLA